MKGVCASSTATTAKGSSCRGTHGVLKEYSQGTHGYSRVLKGYSDDATATTTGKGFSCRGTKPKERPGRPCPAGARPTEGGVSPTILSPRSGGQGRAQPVSARAAVGSPWHSGWAHPATLSPKSAKKATSAGTHRVLRELHSGTAALQGSLCCHTGTLRSTLRVLEGALRVLQEELEEALRVRKELL
jgi:hypothetical protein